MIVFFMSFVMIPSPSANMPANWMLNSKAAAPSFAAVGQKLTYVYLFGGDRPTYQAQLEKAKGAVNGVFVPWLDVNKEGKLSIRHDPEFISWVQERNLKIYPFLSNHFHQAGGDKFLDPTQQEQHIDELASYLEQTGVDGINIDLENFSPESKGLFVDFLSKLSARTKTLGKTLSVAVAPATTPEPKGWASAYDYKTIGRLADQVIIMAYDQHFAGSAPGPVASQPWVDAVVKNLSFIMPPEKMILGIPFYGRYWINGKNGNGISYVAAKALSNKNSSDLTYHRQFGVYSISYSNESGKHDIWLDNRSSLMSKMRLVHQYNLSGVAAWRLGLEDPQLWPIFQPWLQNLSFQDLANSPLQAAASKMILNGLMEPEDDGLFHSQKPLTKAEVIYAIVNAVPEIKPGKELPFRDVSKAHWAYNALASAFAAGWLTGDADGKLQPDEPITRAETAALLTSAYQLKRPAVFAPYTDVPAVHPASSAIASVASQGWLEQSSAAFAPEAAITKGDLALILSKALPKENSQ